MKFQLRRFAAAVPWGDWGIVLAGLLFVVVYIYTAERDMSKKRRCPTCNQVVKGAK